MGYPSLEYRHFGNLYHHFSIDSLVEGGRCERAYFRVGGVASNSSSIPLNPPSKGGLPIRFPPFSRGARGDHHSSPPNLRYARCEPLPIFQQTFNQIDRFFHITGYVQPHRTQLSEKHLARGIYPQKNDGLLVFEG